ncbi:MAG: DUF4062 domain-containing protein [Desulfosoma sp.]
MALLKTAVFIASRFEEFTELRRQLKDLIANHRAVQLTPIDLNDGHVSHRPPLAECLGYVRRSEFMILLLGDTYGSLAPKTDKSFTHLEYEEAISEGSGTRVLVFGIGEHYRGGRLRYSDDRRLAAWQKQVEENHTMGFFDPETPVEVIAQTIFNKLLAALYEMRFGALSVEEREDVQYELFDAIEDESLLDDSEVRALEERNSLSPSLVDDKAHFTNTLAAITQPAAVAALEQRVQAQRALDVGEWSVAIRHLKRALEFKPLDLMSNYWLAQLYVALGRKEKAFEAMDRAERAGRIAELEKLPYRASAAYMVAARAAQLAGRLDEALRFAKQAVEVAPRFARAYVELARQSMLCRENERKATLEAIETAFRIYPKSLREVYRDPVFRPIRKEIGKLLQQLEEKIARDAADVVRIEGEIAKLAGKSAVEVKLEGKTINLLIEAGRESCRRQYDYLCTLVDEAEQKMQELHAEAPKLPPATKELLKFNRPGRAQIVQWFKKPGDVIRPEETVFSFQHEGSTKIIPWLFRGHTAVRMTARTGDDGTWVFSDDSYIFEHVPATVELPEPSRVQRLREEIETTESRLLAVEERLKNNCLRKDEIAHSLKSFPRHGIDIPGMAMLLTSAVGAVLGSLLIYLGLLRYAILPFFIAIFFASVGYDRRREYRSMLGELQLSLDEIKRDVGQDTREKALYEQELASLRNELGAIEKACEDAKDRARKALKHFEGVTLRKVGMLLPFPSIYGVRVGDVVRIFDRQVDQIKNESSRDVELRDDLPEWLMREGEAKGKAYLMRVMEASPERVLLSHWHAYSGAKKNQ